MVDGNKLAEVGFQYLGVSYSKMDCQAFVEQCLRDCGLNMNLAGSNAWYREVMKNGAILTPEECVKQLGKVPAGAFLFIWANDGKEPSKYQGDGIGNASHIGIVTNQTAEQMMAEILATIEDAKKRKEFIEKVSHGNGAINSSYSRDCVCTSSFAGKSISGGWNRVGLWDRVEYDYGGKQPDTTPEPEPETWTAKVWAASGTTVNLRKSKSKLSALVERIKIGETVEVLEYGEKWCRIQWRNKTGYMMTEFLIFDDQIDEKYTVIIEGLSYSEAQAIKKEYPKATISAG